MTSPELSERERRVLEAVIQNYVETAEPAGSRMISRRFGIGVSPATIRNTMSDLEEKGYLFHPHTSAGRVPTDKGYRVYVDSLCRVAPLHASERDRLTEEITTGGSAIETILRRAAQSVGLLTQELGVALGPRLDHAVLQRLDLVRLSSERILMVLTLQGASMRSIFIEVRGEVAESALVEVARVLNERLGGLTLRDIRSSLSQRLRDPGGSPDASDLLNIFVEQGDHLFDVPLASDEHSVLLGQASLLAEQPEFSSGEQMRRLIQLTETRQQLGELLRGRSLTPGITITIGNEHSDPRYESFTVVTAEYHSGPLCGVIGVIGPTRMPYEKVIALVSHASQLVSEILG